ETCDVRHDPLIKGVLEIGGIAAIVADDNDGTCGKAIAHSIDIDGFLACHDRASEVVSMAQSNDVIKAYLQPGCTSFLRVKEFLTKHGVPFVSINVLEDKQGFAELAELDIRTVPIVRRGTKWANGQVLRDVARVAGIAWAGAPMLPVPELVSRLIEIDGATA